MICALCLQNEADAKNTHYLTDGIIRRCLNLEGSNIREKGFYFDFSNNSAFVDFNFQRETSQVKLEESLERLPTDEEIEKAKKNPFSVDDIFCKRCESIFGEIEDDFFKSILPKLREVDLTQKSELNFPEAFEIRMFFYLQIWRTAACVEDFLISADTFEQLRKRILNYKNNLEEPINKYPLYIIYLETIGGQDKYTSNNVGHTSDTNPNLILFNDFVIQFYENNSNLELLDFYGLNDPSTYQSFINFEETNFKIRIINNEERLIYLKNFMYEVKLKPLINNCLFMFTEFCKQKLNIIPDQKSIDEYLGLLIDNDFKVLKYSKENILRLTYQFIQDKLEGKK